MNANLKVVWIVISLLVLLLSAGCAGSNPSEVQAGAGEDNQQIQLKAGQTLVVRLESNITTGYSWEIAKLDGVLRSSGEPEYQAPEASSAQRVGAGGSQVFRFQASGAGSADLQLAYRRPWEKDTPPARTYHLTVIVKE